MAKIILHPAVQKNLEKRIINIAEGKEAPFKNVERTKNKAFNSFMNRADEMFNSDNAKDLEKEALLFQSALEKNPEFVELSKQIGEMRPKTTNQIAEYREKTNRLLEFTKKIGANTLHENMKITFDLMLDMAEKGTLFKIDTII